MTESAQSLFITMVTDGENQQTYYDQAFSVTCLKSFILAFYYIIAVYYTTCTCIILNKGIGNVYIFVHQMIVFNRDVFKCLATFKTKIPCCPARRKHISDWSRQERI